MLVFVVAAQNRMQDPRLNCNHLQHPESGGELKRLSPVPFLETREDVFMLDRQGCQEELVSRSTPSL